MSYEISPEEKRAIFEEAVVRGLMPGACAGYKLVAAEEKTAGGLVLPAMAGQSHQQDGTAFVVIGTSAVYTDTSGKLHDGHVPGLPKPGDIVFCRSQREWKHPFIKSGISYFVTCQCVAHVDLYKDPYYMSVAKDMRTESGETLLDCAKRLRPRRFPDIEEFDPDSKDEFEFKFPEGKNTVYFPEDFPDSIFVHDPARGRALELTNRKTEYQKHEALGGWKFDEHLRRMRAEINDYFRMIPKPEWKK